MWADMTLSALLVCVDEASARLLQKALEELNIEVESCPDFVRAGIRLAQERFDAVIIDGKSTKQVISLLRETRQSRRNDATLAVAVLAGQENIRDVFSLGANFILYKPLAYDRALSSLRAARGVMYREKRKKARAPVHAQATIDYANVEQEKATLIDLAENGMSVQFGQKLPPVNKVYFQFKLPGQTTNIRLSGQVMWQDWKGRAGVQFADVPQASRRLLADFLAANLPKEVSRDPLFDVAVEEVTVEMEEVQQPPAALAAAVAAAVATLPPALAYEREAISSTAVAEEPPSLQSEIVGSGNVGLDGMEADSTELEGVSDSALDAANRRTKTRYTCRLSAEVYRPGLSIPHRCCLTDLSSGGCYLEVALPFPQGSALEIIVRTYEMRLRLRGMVLASHPGYGMSVSFQLDNDEELSNLKKLTAFVAAAAPKMTPFDRRRAR
jgi:CheY-like chemotaxis protein